jgi:uncharacterized membrane protein
MDKTLTAFIWVWISLILLLNVLAIVGIFIGADSVWDGVQKVQEIYSPFNIINWIVELVTWSPAIGAYVWRERRRNSLRVH